MAKPRFRVRAGGSQVLVHLWSVIRFGGQIQEIWVGPFESLDEAYEFRLTQRPPIK